jgi:hypothetical protein
MRRVAAYYHRELQWMAAFTADIVAVTMWPYRTGYDGKPLPPRDTFNTDQHEVAVALAEESPFGRAVRAWQGKLYEAMKQFKWTQSLGPDGSKPSNRQRTLTGVFTEWQWEQDKFNTGVRDDLQTLFAHCTGLRELLTQTRTDLILSTREEVAAIARQQAEQTELIKALSALVCGMAKHLQHDV